VHFELAAKSDRTAIRVQSRQANFEDQVLNSEQQSLRHQPTVQLQFAQVRRAIPNR
jgi:hypothetical protein